MEKDVPCLQVRNIRFFKPISSDFWCENPFTAIECTGSTKFCDNYRHSRAGKPVEVKLAYESGCPDSQRLIVDRLYPKVLNNSYFSQLIDFKAYPYGLAKRASGKVNCHHGTNIIPSAKLLRFSLKTKKIQQLRNFRFTRMRW